MEKDLTLRIRAKNLAKAAFGEVRTGLNKLGKTLKSIESQVFSFKGAIAGLVVALGARELGSSLQVAGTDIERFRSQLQALYQGNISLAEQALQSVIEFAEKTPFYTKDVVDAFILLESTGIGASKRLLTVLGDTAFIFNRNISDVASALISMETEVWRRLGVVIDRTGKKAILTSGNVRMEVDNNIASIRAALVDLLEKRFSGGMQQAEKTFTGIMRIIGSIWDIFLYEVTESGLWDYIKAVFQTLLDYINKFRQEGKLDEWAKNISEALVWCFQKGVEAVGLFVKTIDVLKMAWEGVKGVIALALSTILTGISGVLEGLGKVVGFFKKDWGEALQGASETLRDLRDKLLNSASESFEAVDKNYKKVLEHHEAFQKLEDEINKRFQQNLETTQKLSDAKHSSVQLELNDRLKITEQEEKDRKRRLREEEERKKFEQERLEYFKRIKEEMMSKSELYAKKMEEEIDKYAKTEEEKELIRQYYSQKIEEAKQKELEEERQRQAELLSIKLTGNKDFLDATQADLQYIAKLYNDFSRQYGEDLAKPITAFMAGIDMAINELPRKNEIIANMGKNLVDNLHEGFKGLFKGLITEGIGGIEDAWKQFCSNMKDMFVNTLAEIAASETLHLLKYAIIKIFEDILKAKAVQGVISLFENLFHVIIPGFDFLKLPQSVSRMNIPNVTSAPMVGSRLYKRRPVPIGYIYGGRKGISPRETTYPLIPSPEKELTISPIEMTPETKQVRPTIINVNIEVKTWDTTTMQKTVRDQVIPNIVENIRNYGVLHSEIKRVV